MADLTSIHQTKNEYQPTNQPTNPNMAWQVKQSVVGRRQRRRQMKAKQKRNVVGSVKNAAAEEGDAEKQDADMLEPPGKVARISETLIDPTLESGKAPEITMQTRVVWERKVKYDNL
jgi:hypothetical protein